MVTGNNVRAAMAKLAKAALVKRRQSQKRQATFHKRPISKHRADVAVQSQSTVTRTKTKNGHSSTQQRTSGELASNPIGNIRQCRRRNRVERVSSPTANSDCELSLHYFVCFG